MKKVAYPLEQVLAVKKDRVQKAEKVVEERKRAWEIEKEKLKKIEAERDVVKNHHSDKLAQLREALDTGTTSDEVIQMKTYLKIVKEKLVKEEERVKQQKENVKKADKALDEAKLDLKRKRLEEEKILLHKTEWTKERARELSLEEAKDQDEIGQLQHEARRRQQEKN